MQMHTSSIYIMQTPVK